MRRAVFFDRDDTLIACREVTSDGDLGDADLVQLLPGAARCCATLERLGFALVVVSNQGGVARGRYSESDVRRVNQRLNELLNGVIDAFYFCPFHPKGAVAEYAREHPWRKPAPGMLLAARDDLGLDLARSWMIGDAPRDCEAGKAAGCRTIWLTEETSAPSDAIDNIAGTLLDAMRIIQDTEG